MGTLTDPHDLFLFPSFATSLSAALLSYLCTYGADGYLTISLSAVPARCGQEQICNYPCLVQLGFFPNGGPGFYLSG